VIEEAHVTADKFSAPGLLSLVRPRHLLHHTHLPLNRYHQPFHLEFIAPIFDPAIRVVLSWSAEGALSLALAITARLGFGPALACYVRDEVSPSPLTLFFSACLRLDWPLRPPSLRISQGLWSWQSRRASVSAHALVCLHWRGGSQTVKCSARILKAAGGGSGWRICCEGAPRECLFALIRLDWADRLDTEWHTTFFARQVLVHWLMLQLTIIHVHSYDALFRLNSKTACMPHFLSNTRLTCMVSSAPNPSTSYTMLIILSLPQRRAWPQRGLFH